MTVNELIERLQEYANEGQGDDDVLLMSQPGWPFEYGIAGLTTRSEIVADESDDDRDGDACDGDAVFIVEGRQLRYGSRSAWEVAT